MGLLINTLTQLPLYQQILLAIFVVTFICQCIYWFRYGSISKYRNQYRISSRSSLPPVSVVVIITGDKEDYIYNGLPLLLEQEHHKFEIVAVNDCGGIDIDTKLTMLAKEYSNLKFTTLKQDDKFNHSRKIPLVIGIKAAQYENILVTDTDALPTNERWLSYMSRGFSGADLVIGYTGFELRKGITNTLARCGRLTSSIRYLRAATSGKPYKGVYNNIGYTKTIFFDSRGYTNHAMTIGEDDLFVQKIAPKCRTSIIINPQSTLRQEPYNGIRNWWKDQRYHTYGFKYYPSRVKFSIFTELFSRILFFTLTLALIPLSVLQIITIEYLWIAIAGLFIVRETILIRAVNKIATRLGEIKILGRFILYDLYSPLLETLLACSRRMSPPKNLWIQSTK